MVGTDSMEAKAAYGIWLCALFMAIPCIFVIVGMAFLQYSHMHINMVFLKGQCREIFCLIRLFKIFPSCSENFELTKNMCFFQTLGLECLVKTRAMVETASVNLSEPADPLKKLIVGKFSDTSQDSAITAFKSINNSHIVVRFCSKKAILPQLPV
jgi:hypothetical protein